MGAGPGGIRRRHFLRLLATPARHCRRVLAAFPILGSPAGLAAEATVCAQLLQTVSRGDNLVLEDRLRSWAEDLRRRRP
jgi:hypothetical protein